MMMIMMMLMMMTMMMMIKRVRGCWYHNLVFSLICGNFSAIFRFIHFISVANTFTEMKRM